MYDYSSPTCELFMKKQRKLQPQETESHQVLGKEGQIRYRLYSVDGPVRFGASVQLNDGMVATPWPVS